MLSHINLRTMAAAFNPYGSHIHDDEDSRDDYGPQRNVRESGTPESKRSGFSFMDTTHSFFQRMGSPFSRASKRSQWDDYDSGEEWEEEEEREEASPSPPRPKRDLSRVRSDETIQKIFYRRNYCGCSHGIIFVTGLYRSVGKSEAEAQVCATQVCNSHWIRVICSYLLDTYDMFIPVVSLLTIIL